MFQNKQINFPFFLNVFDRFIYQFYFSLGYKVDKSVFVFVCVWMKIKRNLIEFFFFRCCCWKLSIQVEFCKRIAIELTEIHSTLQEKNKITLLENTACWFLFSNENANVDHRLNNRLIVRSIQKKSTFNN